jgi:hypothetical protein
VDRSSELTLAGILTPDEVPAMFREAGAEAAQAQMLDCERRFHHRHGELTRAGEFERASSLTDGWWRVRNAYAKCFKPGPPLRRHERRHSHVRPDGLLEVVRPTNTSVGQHRRASGSRPVVRRGSRRVTSTRAPPSGDDPDLDHSPRRLLREGWA